MAKKKGNISQFGSYDGFGIKGNIFDVGDWMKVIIAGFVLIMGFVASQNASNKVAEILPVDNKVDPIIHQTEKSGIRRLPLSNQ